MATTPQTVYEPHAGRPSEPPGAGPAPSLDALHAHGRVRRRTRDPDHRARRGLLRLRRARQALPRRPLGALLRERRPRPRRARRGGRRAGQGARLLHELELRAPAGDRAGRADRRASRPATSTASSSPRAARRRSSRPGSWRASTTSSAATRCKTKIISRETAYHGTTFGALSITGITPLRTPFEPLVPGAHHVPNTNSTAGPRTATRSGPRTRSSTGSSSRARRPSPP